MATTAFTAWYDRVLPYLPSCPDPVALQKIREAAIAYCRISRTWRHLDLSAIDLVAGQQTYVIGTAAGVGELPANTVVVHVFQALYNDVELSPCTPQAFRDQSPTWFDDAGEPESFTLFNEGEVSLWRVPESDEDGALILPEIALAPSQESTSVDERVWQFAADTIAKGAIALIHQIPKKPYSDVPLGLSEWADFSVEAGGANLRASSGRGHARLRTRTISR